MNKFINILLLLIIFPVMALTIVIGFDIPIDFLKFSGANMPYKTEVFLSFAALIFLIGGRRATKRWMGLRMVNQLSKFQWNEPMAKNRYKQSLLYLYLEAFIHFFLAFALFSVSDKSIAVCAVLVVLGIDHLLFAIIAKSKNLFRVGITSKAILIADRDVKVAFFTGLQQVSSHQQTIFFDYSKDLQIAFPSDSISAENREAFKAQIVSNTDRDRVFFTESFKAF
jgi:hypothetical protein